MLEDDVKDLTCAYFPLVVMINTLLIGVS